MELDEIWDGGIPHGGEVLRSYYSFRECMEQNKSKYGANKLKMAGHHTLQYRVLLSGPNFLYIQNNFKTYDFSLSSKEILIKLGAIEVHTLGKVS